MEVEDLVERILQDIKSSFIKEPNIDEFDIIPVLDSRNKCPVVVIGTKMALEAWCIKLIWLHVYQRLMDWKFEHKVKVDDEKLIQWSEIILLINPDISTVWNIRKQLIVLCKLSIDDDFRLCRLILTRKPKSSEVFTHRRWVLKRICCDEKLVKLKTMEKLMADELLLSSLAASKYPNNYSAWSHREWLHENIASNDFKILLDDLKWNESYVQLHVSDYSGFHFRQYLIKQISAHLNSPTSNPPSDSCPGNNEQITLHKLLETEWTFVNELMEDYCGHEALWYHRRFVIQWLNSSHLVQCDISTGSLTSDERPLCKKTRKDTSSTQLSTTAHVLRLDDEVQFVTQTTGKESQSFISNHKRWLAYIFKLDFQ